MKVSPNQPFKIIYSLFEHQYLGYLFESFAVEENDVGKLTLKYQNISSMNAREFASGLNETDYQLVELMDSMQQDSVIKRFYDKKINARAFFQQVYEGNGKHEALRKEIAIYLEKRRAKILKMLPGKLVYEMGNDGNPAYRRLIVEPEKATILFHFRRNENNTHYFPTIKHHGQKLEFQYRNGIIICNEPAWLMVDGHVYAFDKDPDGNKLKPFLRKKFIAIPRNMEETYYQKFVTPLVESFDVYAKGFEIKTFREKPGAELVISEVQEQEGQPSLFGSNEKADSQESRRMLLQLLFHYGEFTFDKPSRQPVKVSLKKTGDDYTFYRVQRQPGTEQQIATLLAEKGVKLQEFRAVLDKQQAIGFMSENRQWLAENGIATSQKMATGKQYFIGHTNISVEITENNDWFDINAKVQFGEYEILFSKIRQLIVRDKREFKLPNGEIAVIPEAWFTRYSDLFHLVEMQGDSLALQKHHVAMVQELSDERLAKVSLSKKLEQLRDFSEIEETPLSERFTGTLRPYQKAGFNWMQFLKNYSFGGCLADDMGLGKTIQTLALLQQEKDQSPEGTSLLIMPTSLVYNWKMEARKFTPDLKVLVYTGTDRNKDIAVFNQYDLVLTTYGIVRIDLELLEQFYFNYIILDESQVIKNPASVIAKSVKKLRSRHKLILTGTPIENSTMDLWSQMSFVNPGLLGSQSYFRKEYQLPIEKRNDQHKSQRLHSIIKPFIMRRHKSQVASELPEKIEKLQYVSMTAEQEEEYEKVKSKYRNQIMDLLETGGLGKSQMVLLQGLTVLRQIANHPRLVDPESPCSSGKMEDVMHMLLTTISEGHKILVFSQFVKHLQLLRQELDTLKIRYAYLDGATTDRQERVTTFQQDESLRLFLISLKAGGLGLNLTAADYVFILDPWWNPAVEAQAVDRAHRIGQENRVFIYKFITQNTVEEKILELQRRKMKLADQLITTEQSFIKQLGREDIEALFV